MTKLIIRSKDDATDSVCNRVLEQFQLEIPQFKLLIFIDDVDCTELKDRAGSVNRGIFVAPFYQAATTNYPPLPDYVRSLEHQSRMLTGWAYNCVIYIHGSTRNPIESLVITLSHELQHLIQYTEQRKLYIANKLLELLLGGYGVPSEQDAIRRSKQVAADLCGEECVRQYAETQANCLTGDESSRWRYFLCLPPSQPDSFADETVLLCQRHRERLKEIVARSSDSDRLLFESLDLDTPETMRIQHGPVT